MARSRIPENIAVQTVVGVVAVTGTRALVVTGPLDWRAVAATVLLAVLVASGIELLRAWRRRRSVPPGAPVDFRTRAAVIGLGILLALGLTAAAVQGIRFGVAGPWERTASEVPASACDALHRAGLDQVWPARTEVPTDTPHRCLVVGDHGAPLQSLMVTITVWPGDLVTSPVGAARASYGGLVRYRAPVTRLDGVGDEAFLSRDDPFARAQARVADVTLDLYAVLDAGSRPDVLRPILAGLAAQVHT